jgi:hypothetical protein
MRILGRAAIAGAVAVAMYAAPVRAQNSFEGVIEFKFEGRDSVGMVQTSKGNMVRIDGLGGGTMKVSMILDTKSNTMTMVMYDRKMYMVNPMPSLDSALNASTQKTTISKTGETQTVAGVSCDIYKGTTTKDDGKVEEGQACLAKGVGFVFFSAMNRGRPSPQGSTAEVFRELAAKDLHMVKAWTMKDGQMKPVLEAVKIERKSVPNSTFEVPADFVKMTMPMGMGGMPQKP